MEIFGIPHQAFLGQRADSAMIASSICEARLWMRAIDAAELVDGKIAADLVDEAWITETFIPTVATRGGAIIKARGLSSAASAANATIDHMRDWILGTDDWVSMSVPSDGSYGVTEGIVSSFPCVASGGSYEIVQGIELSDFSRERIMASVARLESERDQVKALGLI